MQCDEALPLLAVTRLVTNEQRRCLTELPHLVLSTGTCSRKLGWLGVQAVKMQLVSQAYTDGSAKTPPFESAFYFFSVYHPSSISPLICPIIFPKSQLLVGMGRGEILMRAGERLINADESLLSCTSVTGDSVVWVCMQTVLAVSTRDSALQHSLPSPSWKLGFPSSV